jgi:Glyoxalase/Bleomycin resistance protein/Dioxygenase superfamily
MEKTSFSFSLGAVMQVAFVVDDMERELEHWTRTLRVGPFFYLPHFPLINAQYRGSPIALDIAVALAFSGTTCYELIRQNSDAPSPFQKTPTERRYGFHHWAIPTRTFDTDLAERQRSGMTLVASATVGLGGRVAYLETASQLGGMLELLEFTPDVEGVFSMIHAASESWDGTDPVRQIGPPR